jgi:hypothetical protein
VPESEEIDSISESDGKNFSPTIGCEPSLPSSIDGPAVHNCMASSTNLTVLRCSTVNSMFFFLSRMVAVSAAVPPTASVRILVTSESIP